MKPAHNTLLHLAACVEWWLLSRKLIPKESRRGFDSLVSGWAHLDPLAVAGLMSTESCIALVANLVTVILSYRSVMVHYRFLR
jgi:hypothetical protein